MSNAIAVNLRRFRKLKKLTQEQLASAAKITRVAYRNLESGLSEPRKGTLDALAGALKVNVFDIAAPVPRPATLRFRSHKTLSTQEHAEREQLVVETLNWLVDFNELEEVLNQRAPSKLPARMPGQDIPAFAESVRQSAFSNDASARMPELCDILEGGGIKVRLVDSSIKGVFGFSVGPNDGGPAIVVNAAPSIPVERRIFTAAHELGHLVLHADSFNPDEYTENDEQETEANVFASHFLMPGEQFLAEWNSTSGLPWVDRVMKTKRVFRVSWMTVVYRLCELNLADKSAFQRFRVEFKNKYHKDVPSRSEPDAPASAVQKEEPAQLSEFDFYEDRFRHLVREALVNRKISISRAAEMLGESVQTVRNMLAHEWERPA